MATTITDAGFIRDRLDTILANVDAAMRGIYGDDIDLSPSSPDGQFDGILAEAIDTVGQLAEDVFAARAPAGARGAALSRLVKLNGINRIGETYSTAAVTFTGTPGTVISDGSLVDNTDTPPSHFQTVGDVTIDGTGTAPGTVQATVAGPVFAAAGTITAIKTVISGWTSVTNPAAVNLGSAVETDAALRIRRAASVAITSQSIVDGIYAALANVQGVSDVAVFENKTGSPVPRTGASDLPSNSVQCVVRGGLDSDVANAIWQKSSAGVTLVGAASYGVIDAQGNVQTIKFDRPTNAAIFARITLTYPTVTGTVPSDALKLALCKALVDYGNSTAKMGALVVWAKMFPPLLEVLGDVTKPSSVGVSGLSLGLSSGSMIGADVVVPPTGIATWDVSNASVIVFGYPG